MPRSLWLSIVAIAVWSATIVVLAQTPSGEGVSTESPAIEEQTPNSSSSSKASPPENAIPVRIIEDPIEADHRKEREAKSDQHESDDLAAQRKAADAAWKGAIRAYAASSCPITVRTSSLLSVGYS